MSIFNIKLLSIIIICCLGKIIYSQTFFSSFHFDDNYFIVDNPSIRHMGHLFKIWDFLPCRFITLLSIAINYHFQQFYVFGYHLFNLIVHLASACFVWWLVLLTLSTPAMKEDKITRQADLLALFAGLVFVSHPIQTEAVTYIWQRAASLATLFYLASLCFYIKSRDAINGVSMGIYYIAALIAAVLAMFTKEIAITLPLMILLYEFCFFVGAGTRSAPTINWRFLFPFLLTLAFIPLTILFTEVYRFHQILGYPKGSKDITVWHYFLTQLRVIVTYIRLVFLPINQNLDYDYPIYKSIFDLPVLTSVLFLMAILFCAKRLYLNYRLVSFSIFWFFLSLMPESSFLPLGDVIFEHRLYLPMVGYSLFLVSGLYYLWEVNHFRTMVIALIMIIACYSFLTYQRNKVWRDDFTLWDDAVRKSPHKARPYNNRGVAYTREGDLIQALSDFNRAIELNPRSPEAYNNRGSMYSQQGNYIQAIVNLNKAIEMDPHYAIAYNNRAHAFYHLKEYGKAWADVQRSEKLGVDLDPIFVSKLKKAWGQ